MKFYLLHQRLLGVIIITGLWFFVFLPTALADGPDVKTFGYNSIGTQALTKTVIIPFLAKNHEGWTSTLVVANPNPNSTDLTINIWYANGVFAKLINMSLVGYGAYILNLAEVTDLGGGRYHARISSTTAEIMTEVHTESAYMAMSYPSVGTSAESLIVPIIEKKADNWNTRFYIHNTEPDGAVLTTTYYATNNPNPVLTITDTVVAPLQSLEFETLAESRLPDGFTGYARLSANRVMGAAVIRQNYVQESAMIYPAVQSSLLGGLPRMDNPRVGLTDPSFVEPSFLWSIPLVSKQDDIWGSSILQTRPLENELTSVLYNFYSDNGVSAGNIQFELEPGVTHRHRLDDLEFLDSGFRGSVQVLSDRPLWTLVGQEKQEAGDLFGYFSNGDAAFVTHEPLYVPYLSKGGASDGWNTTPSILNPSSSTSQVQILFFDPTGAVFTETVDIPASASSLLDLSSLGSLPDGFEGQARVTSLSSAPTLAVVIGDKPQVAGNHARVVKDGLPRENAVIFYDGQKQGVTDPEGVLPLGDLTIGEPLIVVDPVKEITTIRAGHDGWAYRIHTTNVSVNNDGSVTPVYTVTTTGRQILTTSVENTLVLFNIVVSIEWDADDAYMQTISNAFKLASDYLYDMTDGQMAFGQVKIYDNARYWSHADFQISTKNTVRPYAFIGGITSEDTAHSIRVGRFWSGSSGNEGDWDQPYGYRTLVHEFGHYAFYLHDEYFVRVLDANGHFSGQNSAACTGPEIISDPETPSNASVMYYQYKASELPDADHWNLNCQQTEQHRVHGKADWQTVLDYYGGPDWTLNTPASRGSVMAGPEAFPDHLLSFPEIFTYDEGAPGGAARELTVVDSQGRLVHNALVALYTTPQSYTIAIDQGLTDAEGHITVYGAAPGDRIQGATFDGALAGAIVVGDPTSYTLSLAVVGRSGWGKQLAGEAPYLSMTPQSDGTSLYLQVAGLAESALPLNAFVVPAEGGGSPQSTALAYSPAEGAYVGATSLEGVGLGTGRVQVSGGSLVVGFNSDYNLQRVLAEQTNGLYSEDGNFSLTIPPHSLAGGAGGYATVLPTGYVPGPLPEGKQVIGSAYEVRISGATVELTKTGLAAMRYHPEVMGVYTNTAIYYWSAGEGEWQVVGGELRAVDHAYVATTTRLGIYSLMGAPVQRQVYLPIIIK